MRNVVGVFSIGRLGAKQKRSDDSECGGYAAHAKC